MNFKNQNFLENPLYKHMELNKLLNIDTTTRFIHTSHPYSSSIVVTPTRVDINTRIQNYVFRDVKVIGQDQIDPYRYLFENQNTLGDETLDAKLNGIVITNKHQFKHYSVNYVHPEESFSTQSVMPLYIEIAPYSKVVLHEKFYNDACLKIFKIVYVLREGASLIVTKFIEPASSAVGGSSDVMRAQVIENNFIQHPGSTLSITVNNKCQHLQHNNQYLQDLYFVTSYGETNTKIVGRYNAKNTDSVHVVTDINHIASNSTSEVDIKCVADDHSRVTFAGNINVAKEATGVDANLQNKNLQMSDKSIVVTEPKLDIRTKEIACKHGCTVSSVDPQQLYLLNTKGIDTLTAKKILVESFLSHSETENHD